MGGHCPEVIVALMHLFRHVCGQFLTSTCQAVIVVCCSIAALVAANRDFAPVVNTWADTDVILSAPLNQLATCNRECCSAVLQLVGIN